MLGQLDLDDIGAPIGQLANGRRTRADAREVKDSEARQRAGSIRNGHVLTSSVLIAKFASLCGTLGANFAT